MVVFIDERAIGPAAMIPLLADELYVTPLCVWGDMSYNIDPFVSFDVLKMKVVSLITAESPLNQIAQAMIDPSVQIAGLQETAGGPLILNTQQMTQLGLVSQILDEGQFHQKYPSLEDDMQSILTPSSLRKEMEEYIRVYPVGVNLVGYLDIGNKEPISETTYLYVKYALEEYVKKSVSCILLHLDSPGGEILSALKIASLLQTVDLVHHIPVICFIDKMALSSGALIAYSCRFIGASTLAVMGATEHGEAPPDGSMGQAKERVITALCNEIGALASFYGRNAAVAEAMIDPNIVLVLRDGAILDLKPDQALERNDVVLSDRLALFTLHGQELFEFGVAQFVLQPELLKEITQDQLDLGRWPASYELAFQQPYLKDIPNAQITAYSNPKIEIYAVLTNPLIFALLIIGLFLGMYIEMHTPGFGIAGIVAMACLGTLVGLNFILHTVGWIEIIMLISGILCLLIDIFLASGLGVVGILGMGLTLLGLLAMMLPGLERIELLNIDSFVLFFNVIIYRTICFVAALVLTVVGIIALSTWKPERFTPLSKLVIRKEKEDN